MALILSSEIAKFRKASENKYAEVHVFGRELIAFIYLHRLWRASDDNKRPTSSFTLFCLVVKMFKGFCSQTLNKMANNIIIEKLDINAPIMANAKEAIIELQELIERAEQRTERYDLSWSGKARAFAETGMPINKTLRPDLEESVNFNETENLFITGDNLDALKLLQESYLGKVDMIYIDPPYNTGKDFVYHDKFSKTFEEEKEKSKDVDGNRQYTVNSRDNGRYHSDWLSMMYPRLRLARNLLSDSGVIFISIDDNEQANLKLLCDEVFGEENFVADMIWQGGKMNAAKFISTSHEYILIYAKDIKYCSDNGIQWKKRKKGIDIIYQITKTFVKQTRNDYEKTTELLKEWYKQDSSEECKEHSHYCYVDENGIFCMDNVSRVGGGSYSIVNPINGIKIDPPSRGWVFGKEEDFWIAYKNGVIKFQDNDKLPIFKRYLHDNEKQLLDTVFYKDRRGSKIRLRKLMDADVFEFPKDEDVLYDLINAFTTKENNNIILDFFAGSATTAHAVMKLNSEDGGNRKWILVQLDEETEENSEARKAGYQTIDAIARERIRRVAKSLCHSDGSQNLPLFEGIVGVPESISGRNDKQDYGFRALRIDTTNTNDSIFKSPAETTQGDLFSTVDNIKKERTPLDLLFGTLTAMALELNKQLRITNYELRDGTEQRLYVYDYFGELSGLVACFDEIISEEVILEIARMKPLAAVFRDSSFSTASDKVNLAEHFRTISPDTKVKVI